MSHSGERLLGKAPPVSNVAPADIAPVTIAPQNPSPGSGPSSSNARPPAEGVGQSVANAPAVQALPPETPATKQPATGPTIKETGHNLPQDQRQEATSTANRLEPFPAGVSKPTPIPAPPPANPASVAPIPAANRPLEKTALESSSAFAIATPGTPVPKVPGPHRAEPPRAARGTDPGIATISTASETSGPGGLPATNEGKVPAGSSTEPTVPHVVEPRAAQTPVSKETPTSSPPADTAAAAAPNPVATTVPSAPTTLPTAAHGTQPSPPPAPASPPAQTPPRQPIRPAPTPTGTASTPATPATRPASRLSAWHFSFTRTFLLPSVAATLFVFVTLIAWEGHQLNWPLASLPSPATGILLLTFLSKFTDWALAGIADEAWEKLQWGPFLQPRGNLLTFLVVGSRFSAWWKVLWLPHSKAAAPGRSWSPTAVFPRLVLRWFSGRFFGPRFWSLAR